MSIEAKANEYAEQIQAKLKERQEIDDHIARLQNIHNNIAKREEVITDLRRQILQYDVKFGDLFTEAAETEDAKKKNRKVREILDLEAVGD